MQPEMSHPAMVILGCIGTRLIPNAGDESGAKMKEKKKKFVRPLYQAVKVPMVKNDLADFMPILQCL